MKKFLSILCLLALVVTAAWADGPFRNHRYDVFKVMPTNNSQVLFVGNSITNMHPWGEAWGDNATVANRGNSGGMSGEILANIESFISGHPKELYLMIGTNDGMGNEANIPTVVGNIRQILKRITKESPNTKVYLENILQSTSGRTLACISECNRQLAAMVEAEYPDVTVVDLYNAVTGITNGVTSNDRLHIAAPAYKMWMEEIQRVGGMQDYTIQYDATCTGVWYVVNNTTGMRHTYFANLPVHTDDVLFIGDEFVNGGEWPELLDNVHVQNRGWAWGFGGLTLPQYTNSVPHIFGCNRADSQLPKQVLIYAGTPETNAGNAIEGTKTSYKALVDAVRAKAPDAKITLVSLSPHTNATANACVVQLNAYMAELAAADDNMTYADIYTGLNANKAEYMSGNYVMGLGYIYAANVLKDHIEGCGSGILTVEQAKAHKQLLVARDDLYSQIALCEVMAGSSKGATKATLEALAEEAYGVLAADGKTAAEIIAAKNKLQEDMDNARKGVDISFASGWYQIANTNGVVVTSAKGLFMEAIDPGVLYGGYYYDVLATTDASKLSTLFYLTHEPNSSTMTVTLPNGNVLGWNGTHAETAVNYILATPDADKTSFQIKSEAYGGKGGSYLDMFNVGDGSGRVFLGAASGSASTRYKIYDAGDVLGDLIPYRVTINNMPDMTVTLRKSGYTGLPARNGGYLFAEGELTERDLVVNGLGQGNSTVMACVIDNEAHTITYTPEAPDFVPVTLAGLETGWYQIKNIKGRMTTDGQGKYLRAAEAGIVRNNGTYDVIATDDNNSPYTYFHLTRMGDNKFSVKVLTGNYVSGTGIRTSTPVAITFSVPDASKPTDLHLNGGNNWDMFFENGKVLLGASSSSTATTFQLSNATQWVEDNYDFYEVVNQTGEANIGVNCAIDGYDGVKAYNGGYIVLRNGYEFSGHDMAADASATPGKVVEVTVDRDNFIITLTLRDELEFSPVDAEFETGWYQIKNVEAKYTGGQNGLGKLVKFNEDPITGAYNCGFTDAVEDINTFFYLTHTPNSHKVTIQTIDGRYVAEDGTTTTTPFAHNINVKAGATDRCSIGGYLIPFDNYQSKGDIWGKSSAVANVAYYQLNNVDEFINQYYKVYKVQFSELVNSVIYNRAGYQGTMVGDGGYIYVHADETPNPADFVCVTTDPQAICHVGIDEATNTITTHVTYEYDYDAAKFAVSHNLGSPADYDSQYYLDVVAALEAFEHVYEMSAEEPEYCDAIHNLAHALDDYFTVNADNLEEAQDGTYYTLQLASGKTATYMDELGYLNFHTAGINLTDDPTGTDANVKFLCEARDGGKYTLSVKNGDETAYLCFVGSNGEGENGNLGYTTQYIPAVNDLEIVPIVSEHANVTYADYQTIGLVFLRWAQRSQTDERTGVLTFTPTLQPISSNAPYYNGAYSSAFIMVETEAPEVVEPGPGTKVELNAAASRQHTVYDLQGRRVNGAARGLFIIDGKKVVK